MWFILPFVKDVVFDWPLEDGIGNDTGEKEHRIHTQYIWIIS